MVKIYKLSIWQNDEKTVEEFDDEDEMRDRVNDCINDLEHKTIKTFAVSWISQYTHDQEYWKNVIS